MATHWHILGAGSIGCLFASALHRAGSGATLLLRSPDAESPLAKVIVEAQGGSSALTLPVSPSADTAYIGHLLLTTKAYDAGAALASVEHRLDLNSHIVLLVNGMGILEELAADHPQLRFYCGTTTEGAYRTAPREIVHAGTGVTKIGRPGKLSAPKWFASWEQLSLVCDWDEDIGASLWQKLAVNCAINPLTALSRCSNGDLLSTPQLHARLMPICAEIAAVLDAADQGAIALTLPDEVRRVIASTAKNRSSMLQDVLAGRRTEVEYISGYLVRAARALAVPVPLNENLLQDIRKIDT